MYLETSLRLSRNVRRKAVRLVGVGLLASLLGVPASVGQQNSGVVPGQASLIEILNSRPAIVETGFGVTVLDSMESLTGWTLTGSGTDLGGTTLSLSERITRSLPCAPTPSYRRDVL